MKRHVISLALMAAMQTMQNLPPKLKTIDHKLRGFGGVGSKQSKNYFGSSSKYKPHQSKRECARRLRVGSAAWYSAASALKNGHGS